jgi:hypothetical protein
MVADKPENASNQMYNPSIDNIDPDYPTSFETKAFWVESLYASASVLKEAVSSLELAFARPDPAVY